MFHFGPHKNFGELSITRWVTSIGMAAVIFSFYVIIDNTNMVLDLSSNGFNAAVGIFRVPLGILASLVPVLMLLAAIHRSEQTKEQIRVANISGHLSSYFTHIEEFEKYMNRVKEQITDIQFPENRELHKHLFPEAYSGDFSLNKNLEEKIKYTISQLIRFLSEVEVTTCKTWYIPKINTTNFIFEELSEVSFIPRFEVYLVALYQMLGFINKDCIQHIMNYHKTGKSGASDETFDESLYDYYESLVQAIHLVLKFNPNLDLDILPNIDALVSMDTKDYVKKYSPPLQEMHIEYSPFGMVFKVRFME